MTINNRLSLEARYEHLTFQDVDFRKSVIFKIIIERSMSGPLKILNPTSAKPNQVRQS
jgi:hypothetical protein